MAGFERVFAALPLAVAFSLVVAGCANSAPQSSEFTASPLLAAPPSTTMTEDYRIGPQDKLSLTVFQVKDLTLSEIQVDSSGRLSLPLIGSVVAQGKTTQELSAEIAARLREGYLQQPQVTVSVIEAISQKVTIDGAVREPGIYAMSGPTTLLQAVAMAKGPDNQYAKLTKVVVFRTVNGERNVAVFNLKDIRAGKAPDPAIYGNDIVVVDGSGIKRAFREIITALPAINVFRPY